MDQLYETNHRRNKRGADRCIKPITGVRVVNYRYMHCRVVIGCDCFGCLFVTNREGVNSYIEFITNKGSHSDVLLSVFKTRIRV